MTPEQSRNRRRLAKKYKICFDGPLPPDQWPLTHADLFRNIQILGQKKYHEYKADRIGRPVDEPWGAHTARRAQRIVNIAKRLRSENRNEAGWRLELEPEIFSRFTIEVACPQCRARTWRSEIEAFIDKDHGINFSLEDRRKRRKPCNCPPVNRRQDISDPGLNPLFSDRAEELVIHDNIIHPDLPKNEHPDRVYGLRETRAFERALNACVRNEQCQSSKAMQVRDAIRSTPFRQDGDSLLYPFLILEAKSEKGQDSFDSIEKQTSFPIRTLLKLQEELQNRCQSQPTWQHGPTVWFFANKGEEWRVSAGLVKVLAGETSYRIIDLWHGRVVSEDGALQLLLIIDHVFDWARDIYRPAILRHLKLLSDPETDDAMSTTHDSDIFSTFRPASSSSGSQPEFEDIAADSGEDGELSDDLRPMQLLDSPKGVLRDAALVEYKFLSFTMTGDSARTILQSFLPSQALRFARNILSALSFRGGLIIVDGETLDRLETMWTGEHRYTNHLVRKEYYTRVMYKTWLTDEWVIVKQVLYLAISEDAINVLTESFNRKKRPYIPSQHATKDQIIGLVQPFRRCTSDYNLRAAAARLALSSYAIRIKFSNTVKLGDASHDARWIPGPQSSQRDCLGFDVPFGLVEEIKGDTTHMIIDEIYRKHKIGRREPTEAYIRRSTSTEIQTLEELVSPNPYPLPGDQCLGPHRSHVIVVGNCLHKSLWTEKSPAVCLFIRSRQEHRDKNLAALRSLIGETIESYPRDDRNILTTNRYGPSKPLSSVKWNIKDTLPHDQEQHQPKIHAWLNHLRDVHGVDKFCGKHVPDSPLGDAAVERFDVQNPHVNRPGDVDAPEVLNEPSPMRYQVHISDEWVDQ